ncbi:MAG: phosphomevalonate kinase, partial [Candidatus Diapherotrites archaeon]|nr:phosphomevalonate kinase [Candidatus Diapherotrites archaeon]
RAKLKELGQKSFIGLETKELSEIIETMAQFGVAAKFSGAGGGDCAIGVCFSKEQKQKIFLALKEKGLNPLEISISLKGVFRIG